MHPVARAPARPRVRTRRRRSWECGDPIAFAAELCVARAAAHTRC